MSERIIPDIPKIKAHWEHRADPVPYLMVPMSDGSVMRFNAEIQHPLLLNIFCMFYSMAYIHLKFH